jgi:hypothetical protein
MNDVTEDWAAYKAQQKLARADRRASAEQQLKNRGINYTMHNGGAHIVIKEGGAIFDYWPGNTRWRMRPGKSQFGEHKLFAAIRERRLLSADFSKLEERVLAYEKIPQRYDPNGPFGNIAGVFKTTTGRAPETDEAIVERMTRAYPHLKGEAK